MLTVPFIESLRIQTPSLEDLLLQIQKVAHALDIREVQGLKIMSLSLENGSVYRDTTSHFDLLVPDMKLDFTLRGGSLIAARRYDFGYSTFGGNEDPAIIFGTNPRMLFFDTDSIRGYEFFVQDLDRISVVDYDKSEGVPVPGTSAVRSGIFTPVESEKILASTSGEQLYLLLRAPFGDDSLAFDADLYRSTFHEYVFGKVVVTPDEATPAELAAFVSPSFALRPQFPNGRPSARSYTVQRDFGGVNLHKPNLSSTVRDEGVIYTYDLNPSSRATLTVQHPDRVESFDVPSRVGVSQFEEMVHTATHPDSRWLTVPNMGLFRYALTVQK